MKKVVDVEQSTSSKIAKGGLLEHGEAKRTLAENSKRLSGKPQVFDRYQDVCSVKNGKHLMAV